MKKMVMLLLSLCLVCLLSGCAVQTSSILSNAKPDSNLYSEASILSNLDSDNNQSSEANLSNSYSDSWQFCEAKIQGTTIYFINSFDNGKIYAMNLDGSDKHKLNDDGCSKLFVSGDKIYYVNGDVNANLYAMNTDGSNKCKLSDDNIISVFLNVSDNRIYYTTDDDNAFYSIKTDGTQKEKISNDPVSDMIVLHDRIYYSAAHVGGIFSMKVDGTEKIKLSDDAPFYIVISGDWIYYVNENDHAKLYAMKTDGSDRHKLSDDYALDMNIVNDRIYYHEGNIWKICSIKTDGSDRKLLSNDDAEWLLVQGGRIYYSISGSKIFSMNTDGSDKLTLTDLAKNTYKDVTYEKTVKLHQGMPNYRFVATGMTGTDMGFVMGLKAYNEKGDVILSADFSQTYGDQLVGNNVRNDMMDTMGLHIVDVNFDGYKDVIILNDFSGAHGNTWYDCWLWNPKTSSFVQSKSFTDICNPALDPQKKCIYSAGGSGAGYWGGSIFQYIGGKFVVTNNLEADSNGLTETKLVGGKMVVVRKVSYTPGEKTEVAEKQYYKDSELWQLDNPRWYMVGGHKADQWLGG